jgi:hypothetical protein
LRDDLRQCPQQELESVCFVTTPRSACLPSGVSLLFSDTLADNGIEAGIFGTSDAILAFIN